jgi:hypothetical protein
MNTNDFVAGIADPGFCLSRFVSGITDAGYSRPTRNHLR